MAKIAVLGAGSWGIATSVLLFSNGHQVTLWEFDHLEMTKLAKDREHKEKLPGIVIPKEITITDDLTSATVGAEMLALALPSHTVREVAKKLVRLKLPDPIIVNLAKGIENDTLCRMSEILKEELSSNLHDKIATLSGPSHAEEVSRKIPTT
ncbi:MAG: glycerol-3-phosphate dehydrogenase, partial [candidate division Zixibacteria bacterium SM1_73]